MEIIGEMVRLRAVERRDLSLLREMLNDPWMESMTEGWHFPISEEMQEKWFQSQSSKNELRCVVDIDGNAVGMMGLYEIDWKNRSGGIYYKMDRCLKNRKRGDTVDAVVSLIRYSFDELGLHLIHAEVLVENEKSRSLLEKLGFQQEGILRQRVYKGGAFHDQLIFSLLKEEYLKKKLFRKGE